MEGAFGVYSKAVGGLLGPGWWPVWPLSTRYAVGDVCSVHGGQLLKATTLKSLGVPIASRRSGHHDSLVHDSQGAVTVTLKAAGTTGPLFSALTDADAGAHLRFSSERTVFAAFPGMEERGEPEPHRLARPLVELYFRQQWEPGWVGVTHLLAAASATVLIAEGSQAEAELRLGAGVAAGPVRVADLAGEVSLARSEQIGLQWLGDAGATPFVRVIRLRRRWWRKVDADFAPRQRIKGLAPGDIPVRLLQQADTDPDEVVETAELDESPSGAAG